MTGCGSGTCRISPDHSGGAGTAIGFLFLYPATYNLLEIPAVLKPQVRMYTTGIIRVTVTPRRWSNPLVRHPSALDR